MSIIHILRSMKTSIKCFLLTIQKRISFTSVLLLVFGVFLLICFLPILGGLSNKNSSIISNQRFFSDEVQGWEKSKSRKAEDYVFSDKITTLTSVNYTCKSEDPLMVILVCTDIEHSEQRLAIRETWAAKARRNNIIVLFVMGINERKEVNSEIMEEHSTYGDIIIEDFIDTYNNLTIKTIMMLKWFNQNCLNAKFLMKIDDDIYLNVNNLLKITESVKESHLSGFLLGKLFTRERPHRRSSSKWFMPKDMFADDLYPHYLCGAGYVMSSKVAEALYRESLRNDLVYLEDLFLTGICAKKANLKPVDHLGFYYFEHPVTVECNSVHSQLVLLSHHLSASKMRNQHEQMLTCWREIMLPEWIRDD